MTRMKQQQQRHGNAPGRPAGGAIADAACKSGSMTQWRCRRDFREFRMLLTAQA
jgi:hypothetical protein